MMFKLTDHNIFIYQTDDCGEPFIKIVCCNNKDYYQFKQQLLDDYEKARKWDELQSRNAHIDFGVWLQDTKLRELIEKRIKIDKTSVRDYEQEMLLKGLLEDSKK